jgi:hypothetical protein
MSPHVILSRISADEPAVEELVSAIAKEIPRRHLC